jgi:hypothetical protein
MSEDAKTYRGRAAHARLGAREATTVTHREIFESLAISYESMALAAEWTEGASQQPQRCLSPIMTPRYGAGTVRSARRAAD